MTGIKTDKLIAYSVEILLSYALIGYFLGKLESPFSLPGSSGIINIYLLLLVMIGLCHFKLKVTNNILVLSAFTVFCIPSLFAYMQTSLTVPNFLVLLSPLVSYLSGSYLYYLSEKKQNQFMVFYFALLVMVFITFIYYSRTPELLILLRDYTFSIVVLVPFIFLLNNTLVRNILFALSFIAILVSVKRSLIIAFAVAIVFYYLVLLLKRKDSRKNRRFLKIVGLVLFIGASFAFIDNSTDISEQLETRFTSMEDDGGSGRTQIYATIAANISQSSDWQFLFGYGFNAVATDISLPAHNDFLEIQYDYGIIALCLWILFIIQMIQKAWTLINGKMLDEAAALSAVLLLWLLVAMTNCLIINPITTSAFFLFFGLYNNIYPRRIR